MKTFIINPSVLHLKPLIKAPARSFSLIYWCLDTAAMMIRG